MSDDRELRFYVGSQRRESREALEVRSPYDGRVIGRTWRATGSDVEEAVGRAGSAASRMRALSGLDRARILEGAVALIDERREAFARVISDEAGKAIRDARGEVSRALLSLTTAAAEATRVGGEWMPLDVLETTRGVWALIRRFPLGAIAAITPFNFPLNLVAHKLGPAIAAGNSVVLKPASATPLTALLVAEVLYEAGLPEDALSVVPCTPAVGEGLVTDPRLKMLTFTGSPDVGWALKAKAGSKRVTLELGGNAAAIIHADTDVARAARRCAAGAFAVAGQSCISVQRILVHDSVHDAFLEQLVGHATALRTGDPADEATDVGPMIDEAAARRAEAWIQEAVAGGARLRAGGERRGTILAPTVLTGTRRDMQVECREVFAPVATVTPYSDIREALARVNDSDYGLQAGLFTRDAGLIFGAYEHLEVGGLVVNEVPSYRVDPMPYGGVKMSGQGREGMRWAIEEMTEEKTLLYNPLDLP